MLGEALLTHLSCFGKLSSSDAAAVRTIEGKVQRYPKLKDIMRIGDSPKVSMIVLRGFVCRYTLRHDGSRQIQSFHMPTETPSLETLHIDYIDMNLATITDAEIGEIDHGELQRVFDEHPKVLGLVWRETLVQAAITREWLVRNSSLPAHAAMAHLFCEMYVRAKAVGLVNDATCDLPISQVVLGEALGLTSVHVNRTLQLLRDSGLVEFRNGQLTVNDFDRLAGIADFDPYYLHLHS